MNAYAILELASESGFTSTEIVALSDQLIYFAEKIIAMEGTQRAKQMPVAYMGVDSEGNPNKFRLNQFSGCIPLYTN